MVNNCVCLCSLKFLWGGSVFADVLLDIPALTSPSYPLLWVWVAVIVLLIVSGLERRRRNGFLWCEFHEVLSGGRGGGGFKGDDFHMNACPSALFKKNCRASWKKSGFPSEALVVAPKALLKLH